jgi:hypothetical protein
MLFPSAEYHCSYLTKPAPSDDTPGMHCMADIREKCRTLDPANDSEGAELILDDTQVLFNIFILSPLPSLNPFHP